MPLAIEEWEPRIEAHLRAAYAAQPQDGGHDLLHVRRVVATALALAEAEGARLEVVLPAAWLHDLVVVPKGDPGRAQASRLSGEAAVRFLADAGYPQELLEDIRHAVEAHSFSAGIEARTPEARVVQDADRLDGLGAIGIARCFGVGAAMGRPLYAEGEPFAESRPLDDGAYSLDHFYVKLFKTAERLTTEAGRAEGRRRAETMRAYLSEFRRELGLP
ncbi:MAG: HD domain-containing protein [Elusimicrobiota bacterium]|jgi:uncharacterized protein